MSADREALKAAVLKALPDQRAMVYLRHDRIADAIVDAVMAVGEEDFADVPRPCCTEFGIFQDMRAEGLGQSFRQTYASLDAAVMAAALMERKEKYPVHVRWRKITHGLWQEVTA